MRGCVRIETLKRKVWAIAQAFLFNVSNIHIQINGFRLSVIQCDCQLYH